MTEDSPSPRYFKDGLGLRPRWRFFFRAPRQYLWLMVPDWVATLMTRWRKWKRV